MYVLLHSSRLCHNIAAQQQIESAKQKTSEVQELFEAESKRRADIQRKYASQEQELCDVLSRLAISEKRCFFCHASTVYIPIVLQKLILSETQFSHFQGGNSGGCRRYCVAVALKD